MIAWILLAVTFAWACVATATILVWQTRNEALKKVGGWYEQRVKDLENETRQLAEQVIASGQIVRPAMPIPEPEPRYEYAYDETGLVSDRLEPRDLPIS